MHGLLRTVGAFAVAMALSLPVFTPALAMAVTPGPEFGQHVSFMAAVEQHPRLHGGQMFGECVASMATGQGCPHHEGS